MRRIALAAAAASILFAASRAAAATYTIDAFTYSRTTNVLVATIGDCVIGSDTCRTEYLSLRSPVRFIPTDPVFPNDPVIPTDPLVGLFMAWNEIVSGYPTDPILPPSPIRSLLTVLGAQGASAIVTTTMTSDTEGVLTAFQPIAPQ